MRGHKRSTVVSSFVELCREKRSCAIYIFQCTAKLCVVERRCAVQSEAVRCRAELCGVERGCAPQSLHHQTEIYINIKKAFFLVRDHTSSSLFDRHRPVQLISTSQLRSACLSSRPLRSSQLRCLRKIVSKTTELISKNSNRIRLHQEKYRNALFFIYD